MCMLVEIINILYRLLEDKLVTVVPYRKICCLILIIGIAIIAIINCNAQGNLWDFDMVGSAFCDSHGLFK